MIKAAPLPFSLGKAGAAETVVIPVSDEVTSRTNRPRWAELLVGLDGLPGDVLEISLNGQALEPGEMDVVQDLEPVERRLEIPPGHGILGFPPRRSLDMTFRGLRLKAPVPWLTRGRNQVSLQLKRRPSGAERPVRVRRMELSIGYASEKIGVNDRRRMDRA